MDDWAGAQTSGHYVWRVANVAATGKLTARRHITDHMVVIPTRYPTAATDRLLDGFDFVCQPDVAVFGRTKYTMIFSLKFQSIVSVAIICRYSFD